MLSIALASTHENAPDQLTSAKLDATRDFATWRIPVKLKTGFRVRQQDRDRDADSITGTLGAGNCSRYREVGFQHGWVDGRYPATPIINTKGVIKDVGFSYLPSGLPSRPAVQFAYAATALPLTNANLDPSVTNSLQNDYQTRETIPAGYVQGEVKLARNLPMTAGVRFEQTIARITSRLENTRGAAPEARFGAYRTAESDYVDWFPNLQFRYEPIPHFTVRANYSTTIRRPRISDLVGRFSVNDIGQIVSASNPSLKPQISSNYDVSLEYYFKPVGVASIGAFRKEIKNYVTATSFRITGNEFGLDLGDYVGWQGNSRVNAGDGTVEGMELNYSQQLSFLPGILRGLGVMDNWTVLTSAGDYNGVVTNLPFKNSLTGLRPRSGNAGVTCNCRRWDLRLMWNCADTYLDVVNLLEENRGRCSGLYREDHRAQTNLFPPVDLDGRAGALLSVSPKWREHPARGIGKDGPVQVGGRMPPPLGCSLGAALIRQAGLLRIHFLPAAAEHGEGLPELAQVAAGHRLMDAEILRPAAARHVVGSEENVPKRQQPREVLVPRLAVARMVPAVKHRRRDHGAQRAEVPVHVRVEKNRVEREHGRGAQRDGGIEAEQQDRRDLRELVHQVVDRMHAHAAEPVQVLGAVMHSVERPPFAGMKKSVRPVADEIGEQVDCDRLEPERLAAERAVAAVFAEPQDVDGRDLREHEPDGGQDEQQPHERLGEQDRDEPVGDIGPPTPADDRLDAPAADEAFDQEKDQRKNHQADRGAKDGLVDGHGTPSDRMRCKLSAARARSASRGKRKTRRCGRSCPGSSSCLPGRS
jgi:hypothetical protein